MHKALWGMVMDKRSIKTLASIEKSFISLLAVKPISEITVTELTQKADLNRRTFYVHYDDIYDLQDKTEKQYVNEFSELVDTYTGQVNSNEYFQHVLGYVFENMMALGVLCRNPNSGLMTQLLKLTIKRGKEVLPFENEETGEYVMSYICWGLIGFLHQLFLSRDSFDGDNTEMISKLINNSITPYLRMD
ncbi:hypothetical protein RD055328_11210 [Companilactobacillus sp. RD055328]|uniref:TetR/AcrR family transcriptional regulator n=1 Tax=Companilactobacillus sp. RD055328 TaxID=2916634 RepID=UPI001FC7DE98|nr:TetR/AcrR family transcriptional regulator [Companilactobacillus sp. RD055328]GKQ43198.1 hypothetical protein RD055328_11210 [Companilactobacillus sp. RD055328]